jgi:UDPglucose 6-dehydrogenase
MKISVIGCGYLGVVHAACLASLGHEVIGIDIDEAKIDTLSRGQAPIFEPGLPELLDSTIARGNLTFSTEFSAAQDAAAHFITVGTPQLPGSFAADISYVDAALDALIPYLEPGSLVIGKSTVPVGTAGRLEEHLRERVPEAKLAWNPEFLREGFAVKDTLAPDRLVYGIGAGDVTSEGILDQIYATSLAGGAPKIVTDFATAELVKVSANAFLATKISFINAMAEIAEATGADVTQLADALGHDVRIGRRFLNSGLGFGGGCLPKDIRAFQARATELGLEESLGFLREVDAINLRRRERMVTLAVESVGGSVADKRFAVLGLAFKPNSDDVRDSPALDVAVRLHALGAKVVATDPAANTTAGARHPQLDYVASATDAAREADAVLVMTEWDDYRALDPVVFGEIVSHRVVIDGRNCLDSALWRDAGWDYRALGRA